MIPKRNNDLLKEFRTSRNFNCENTEKPPRKRGSSHVPPKSQRKGYSAYDDFMVKYRDLEKYIDTFKTRDFVYFFRQTAEDSGYKYVVSNIKKDMAIFKRLSDNYSPAEICCMIEFLYQSDQDYLEKDRLSPNLLASQWVNTIYADMKLWVEDEYVPKSKKKHKNREWTSSVEETESKIGEWE